MQLMPISYLTVMQMDTKTAFSSAFKLQDMTIFMPLIFIDMYPYCRRFEK